MMAAITWHSGKTVDARLVCQRRLYIHGVRRCREGDAQHDGESSDLAWQVELGVELPDQNPYNSLTSFGVADRGGR